MRLLCLVFLIALAPAAWAQSTATYRVTFESTWSASTHPDDFPPNPHFSGLVGATHHDAVSLWAEGEIASNGIESMAETGSKTALLAEVNALIGAGDAGAALSGGGIALSPGAVSLDFDVTEEFALVSLVSMLAPSPDWFVGVAGLDLRASGAWASELVVPLGVYDAGTDSGPNYTSPNEDTDPPEPIFEIVESPFLVGDEVVPVGTFTLLNVVDAEASAPAATLSLDAPAPNPAASQTSVQLSLASPQFVRGEVFDVLGRRVATVHDGVLAAGIHTFDLDVRNLPGGIYFLRVRGAEMQSTRRFVVR
jgi:hypothetical protein